MTRNWNERDHPRDGDGRFRDRVGSGGWAQRISDSIGQGRGEIEPRAGSFIGNVPSTYDNARPWDADSVQGRPLPGGFPDHSGGAGDGTPFDDLPDDPGHGADVKSIDAADLVNNHEMYGGDAYEVYNPESGKWEIFRGGEDSGAGRSGMDAGFVDTDGDGFHFSATPDPEDYEDGENDELFEDAMNSYENDDWRDVALRRRVTPSAVRDSLKRKVRDDSRLNSRISDEDMAQLSDSIMAEVLDRARDDFADNPPGGVGFREFVVDQLAEMLRRSSPEELWPHHF